MAQFDVYINPSRHSRESIPYVVEVQSNLLSELQSRLVMPLAHPQFLTARGPKDLCPEVQVEGSIVRVLPYLAAAVSPRALGRPVASLVHDASVLARALDAVMSGV